MSNVARRENAAVPMGPATILLGVTVVTVLGVWVYYAMRPKEEAPSSTRNGGGNGGGVKHVPLPVIPGTVPGNEWNTVYSGTRVVTLDQGRRYSSEVALPTAFASNPYTLNVTGSIDNVTVGAPQAGPDNVSTRKVSFTPKGPGSIELIWPEGAVPGQTILTQYRRLNLLVAPIA